MKSAEAARLWRHFRTLDRSAASETPGALELAAYAEGRLDEAAAERVEVWFLAHPEVLDDIVATRAGREASASRAVIEHAAALVLADPVRAQIIPFRRPAPYAWRMHVARAAVAASLVLTGLAGFTLGSQSYANLFASTGSVTGGLFDQPVGVFTVEDSAI